jgi:RNA polymerase sigma factor (sigma-70 family)
MLSLKAQHMETALEQMWNTHREYIRRMLISLSRDIDLADDLLQETYVRARDGLASYRGGDARAWLAAIAKNAFYAHARRRYFGSEVRLDEEAPARSDLLGSSRHIALLTLRQAIAGLPDPLRQALLMKHYGGFTYSEIAQRLGCPQGTAQQRVFTAIRRLRETLGALREEMVEVKCGELSGKKLVDYVYGKLSSDDMAAVRKHLDKCPKCRKEVDETAEVFRALDTVECSYKITFFVEAWRSYITITAPWGEAKMEHFEVGPHWRVVYAAMEGEEVVMEELPSEDPNRHRYVPPHLPRAVEPGEIVEVLFVAEQDRWDTSHEETLHAQGNHDFGSDAVYLIALRLDNDETLVKADPEPTELRTDGHTTIYYRGFLPAGQEFKWKVDYREQRAEIGQS